MHPGYKLDSVGALRVALPTEEPFHAYPKPVVAAALGTRPSQFLGAFSAQGCVRGRKFAQVYILLYPFSVNSLCVHHLPYLPY